MANIFRGSTGVKLPRNKVKPTEGVPILSVYQCFLLLIVANTLPICYFLPRILFKYLQFRNNLGNANANPADSHC